MKKQTGSQTSKRKSWHPHQRTPEEEGVHPHLPSSHTTDLIGFGWKGSPVGYHTLSVQEVCQRVDTDIQNGLKLEEARLRLEEGGRNELDSGGEKNLFLVFLKHLFNYLMILLMIAMVLSLITQEWKEAGIIAMIVIGNTFLGFYQEIKSENRLKSLNDMTPQNCKVVRNGEVNEVITAEVVCGDIVVLEEGDMIPADMRLFEVHHLELDEATLTGESSPVHKGTHTLDNADEPLGDRVNMAYSGCLVSKGRGAGIVVSTGMRTELGKIAKSLTSTKQQTTALQTALAKLSYLLLGLGLVFGFVVIAVNEFNLEKEVIMYAISVGVAIIPESLAAVITMTTAIGVSKLAKEKAIVRTLNALEALGTVTDICSDKTGTLTLSKMTATNIWIPNRDITITGSGYDPNGVFKENDQELSFNQIQNSDINLSLLLKCASLCNSSTISENEGEWKGIGDPTEIGLQVMAHKSKMGKPTLLSDERFTFISEMPFDSIVKKMSVIYRDNRENTEYVFLKGAPEAVIGTCIAHLQGDEIVEFTPETFDSFKSLAGEKMAELAGKGLRVLALAFKRDFTYNEEMTREEVDTQMIFLGLVGMYDMPRPESLPSVQSCHEAGIIVRMVTGDHPATAVAISKEINIIQNGEDPHHLCLTAHDFDSLTKEQVDDLELPRVVARCSPDSKVKLIKALHRRGRVVAMTGDGVNDAPALKTADIGVAMGKGGSAVTKQAADVILTDDNFSTIVKAIKEGRRTFYNIRKFVTHLLTANVAQVWALVLGLVIQDDRGESIYPMSPLQILFVNTLCVTPPAIALALEKEDEKIMKFPPIKKKEGVFNNEVICDILISGTLVGGFTLLNFALRIFWFGDGKTGEYCNIETDDECEVVLKARGLSFATQKIQNFCLMQKSSHNYLSNHQKHNLIDTQERPESFWRIIQSSVPQLVFSNYSFQKLFNSTPIQLFNQPLQKFFNPFPFFPSQIDSLPNGFEFQTNLIYENGFMRVKCVLFHPRSVVIPLWNEFKVIQIIILEISCFNFFQNSKTPYVENYFQQEPEGYSSDMDSIHNRISERKRKFEKISTISL